MSNSPFNLDDWSKVRAICSHFGGRRPKKGGIMPWGEDWEFQTRDAADQCYNIIRNLAWFGTEGVVNEISVKHNRQHTVRLEWHVQPENSMDIADYQVSTEVI